MARSQQTFRGMSSIGRQYGSYGLLVSRRGISGELKEMWKLKLWPMKKVTATKSHFPALTLICSKPGAKILPPFFPIQQIFHFPMTGMKGKSKWNSQAFQCLFTVPVHFPRKSSWWTGLAPQTLPVSYTTVPSSSGDGQFAESGRQKTNLTKASLGSKELGPSGSPLCHSKHFPWQTPSAEIEQTFFHSSLSQCTTLGLISFTPIPLLCYIF